MSEVGLQSLDAIEATEATHVPIQGYYLAEDGIDIYYQYFPEILQSAC